jgi:NADPH2:quinone reductase
LWCVRAHTASVNLKGREQLCRPYAGNGAAARTGRDFSGVFESGPREWLGAEVWGTDRDAGFTLDGSHAEFIAIPEAALARKPAALSHAKAACVRVAFLVTWLINFGDLMTGDTLAVVGATGGVGSAVAQLAAAHEAKRIIALDLPPTRGLTRSRQSRRLCAAG